MRVLKVCYIDVFCFLFFWLWFFRIVLFRNIRVYWLLREVVIILWWWEGRGFRYVVDGSCREEGW